MLWEQLIQSPRRPLIGQEPPIQPGAPRLRWKDESFEKWHYSAHLAFPPLSRRVADGQDDLSVWVSHQQILPEYRTWGVSEGLRFGEQCL